MEVHHHPDLHHSKKKWKEYFLEFLMIFLAVTMGFIAENFREYLTTKEKEYEYIHSLIHNLEQDKTDIINTIGDNQKKLNDLDSLLSLSSYSKLNPVNKRSLYQYSRMVSFYSSFSSNDATMTQLKNTGGLQYIRKDHIADSISRYDEIVRSINAAEIPYSKAINDAVDAVSELLLFKVWKDTAYFKNGMATNKELPLLYDNPQKLNIFFNKISLERGWTQNYLNNLQEKLPFTIKLIDLLKKEYEIN
ncbi:MAG TPA: hypothetical protein VMT76_17155 [Puia sp.]|nr:hypothetical protein [Puia sp.]